MGGDLPPLPGTEVLGSAAAPPPGEEIGRSRHGRPLLAHRFGDGPLVVSLVAGCHADEPVGPATLDHLAAYLASLAADSVWLRRFRWLLVPHANPDGEAANQSWTAPPPDATGYDLATYLRHAVRELPGDDVEFGFPRHPGDDGARPENRAIAALLNGEAPLALHASLHGMGLGRGPWFLLDPFWVERGGPLRQALARRVAELGYRLHDVDRRGEKGFWRIAEGFATRPDSRAMRDHFLARGDPETAALFRPSSMELARSLGGDPLTLVSEMPLFLLPEEGEWAAPTLPRSRRLEALHRALAEHGDAVSEATGIRPMPLRDQGILQLALVEQGLRLIAA